MFGLMRAIIGDIWSHPANRGNRLRVLARSFGWQLYKRLIRRSLDIKVFGSLTMRCYPNSSVASNLIYTNGWPDYNEMRFMRRYLRKGDSVLDVGANVGVYTLLAASLVGSEGHVDAYEPGPIALKRLRENVRVNRLSHVKVSGAAVGEAPGVAVFLRDLDSTNRFATADDARKSTVEVSVVKLDEEAAGRTYALGKMDIEGAEPTAFRGAEQLLRGANPPVWIMEFKDRLLKRFGYSATDFAAWLRERGYVLASYEEDHVALRANCSTECENVIAVAESAMERLKQRIPELTVQLFC